MKYSNVKDFPVGTGDYTLHLVAAILRTLRDPRTVCSIFMIGE